MSLFVGLFVGFCLGFGIAAMLTVASRADRDYERLMQDEKERD